MSFAGYAKYKDTGIKWIGEVPAHWRVGRFKHVFRERDERSERGDEVLLSVSSYTGVSPRSEVVEEGEHLSRADSLEGYKICRCGDLVMNIMLAWNRGLGFTAYDGIVSPSYAVFQVIDNSDARFLDYLVRSEEVTGYFKAFSTGVVDSRLRLYPDVFRGLACALPPTPEQREIAGFLDAETQKIDALIAEQQRLIQLLKEKRQAVVSHTITAGLNPDAPKKSSGIEWLGNVPAHWSVSQLRYVVDPTTSITYGIVQAGPHVDGGVPYIRTSDMSGDALPLDGYARTTPEIDAAYSRSRVFAGDIVVAIRATVGKSLLVPRELDGANLTQGTAKISPGPQVSSRFLLEFMNSAHVQDYLNFMSKGATFREITLETLRKTPVLVPPIEEQHRIEERIQDATQSFQLLIDTADGAVALLRERRTALISAAVMGRIDVRGLAVANRAVA